MQILKLFKMKNCSFTSITGQIRCLVESDDKKRENLKIESKT
jgi:hypothetical protein